MNDSSAGMCSLYYTFERLLLLKEGRVGQSTHGLDFSNEIHRHSLLAKVSKSLFMRTHVEL